MNQWVRIDVSGKSSLIAVDRHKLTQELGVQLRDLRLLDPKSSSNPSAILPRERALVVALENIKAVITQNYVLVMNPEGDGVAPFVRELESRLVKSASFSILSDFALMRSLTTSDGLMASGNGFKNVEGYGFGGNGGVQQTDLKCPLPATTPFELKALEVCLESVRSVDTCTSPVACCAAPCHPVFIGHFSFAPRLHREQLSGALTKERHQYAVALLLHVLLVANLLLPVTSEDRLL